MKKILLAGICIVFVISGVYLLKNSRRPNSQTSQSNQPIAAGAVVINMGDDDYQPSEVTIKKGQTVVFVNKSKDWRWPASNLHPTHDIYPEFDPKEPVGTGKSWSFRFDKVGSWRMHDHLAPYITGTITVNP